MGNQPLLLLERQGDPEGGALSGLPLPPDLPPHRVAQLLADRGAEAGSPETAADRSVRLGEPLEDPGLGFRRDPDPGVGHLEPDRNPGGGGVGTGKKRSKAPAPICFFPASIFEMSRTSSIRESIVLAEASIVFA